MSDDGDGICSKGSRPTWKQTLTVHPKARCSRVPGATRREMAASVAVRHGRPADRPSLEESAKDLVARRNMERRRQRSPGQVPRSHRRPDPESTRAVHAQHGLPGLLGLAAQPPARAVRVGGKTLVELGAMPIGEVARFFDSLAGAGHSDATRKPAGTASENRSVARTVRESSPLDRSMRLAD